MVLFDWLPWGVPGSYREVEVLSMQLLNHQDEFVWRLSEPQVQVLELVTAGNGLCHMSRLSRLRDGF